jgi:AraC-like DNA-binding protein
MLRRRCLATTEGLAMTVLVSTSDVSVREREDIWRNAVTNTFVSLDFTFPDPLDFSGEISGEVLGTVVVNRVSATAHSAERTQRLIARDNEMPYYKVAMPLSGFAQVSQDGREASLGPGDLTIYDTSRPYRVTFDRAGQLLILMFPHRDLRLPRDAVAAATATRVSGRAGIGGIVAPMLMNLSSRLDEIGSAQSARLSDNVVDMLGTLYADMLGGSGFRPDDPARTLMSRIRGFIEDNLDQADLDPDTVAAACHVSVSYLHKLFRAEGTSVCRVIRERRLEKCRRDLAAPSRRSRSVGAIGADWGFIDAAHFSRVFKATYGISPRDYRLSRDAVDLQQLADPVSL